MHGYERSLISSEDASKKDRKSEMEDTEQRKTKSENFNAERAQRCREQVLLAQTFKD